MWVKVLKYQHYVHVDKRLKCQNFTQVANHVNIMQ